MESNINSKVLVVDDDPNIYRIIAKELSTVGYEVDSASDGQEALEKATAEDYSLVISDVMMPRMDGLEFFEALKKEKPDTPVILISGHTNFGFAVKGLNLGALAFLVKPFDNAELMKWVDKVSEIQVLERDRSTRESLFSHLDTEIHEMVLTTGLLMEGNNFKLFSQRIIERFLLSKEMSKITSLKGALAVHEALINSVEHGNLRLSSSLKEEFSIGDAVDPYYNKLKERLNDPQYAGTKISVKYVRTSEKTELSIRDEGSGFDHRSMSEIEDYSELPSGRGILLIRSGVDKVRYNESGNKITLTYLIPK